jgi:transposase
MFVECFPTQRQDAFLLGQRHAFEFWGGVPRMAVYDNLKPAVLQVLEGHSRREHELFLHLETCLSFPGTLCQCPCRLGEGVSRKSGRVCT